MDIGWFKLALFILMLVNRVAVGGQQVLSRWFIVKSRRIHDDVLDQVAGLTGVINAVLFAFIVFDVWTHYDRARDTVDQEVALVWQIWRDVETVEPGRGPMEDLIPEALYHQIVEELLKGYVRLVASREWT